MIAAIQFLSGPLREATVTIAIGATSAPIGGQSSMAFQTGTTAGTITFTLTLENNAPQQTSLTIPPLADHPRYRYRRRAPSGRSMSPSPDSTTPIRHRKWLSPFMTSRAMRCRRAQSTSTPPAFQQYFSTTQAGGSFALLAVFPVTGNTTRDRIRNRPDHEFHRHHHRATNPHRPSPCPPSLRYN